MRSFLQFWPERSRASSSSVERGRCREHAQLSTQHHNWVSLTCLSERSRWRRKGRLFCSTRTPLALALWCCWLAPARDPFGISASTCTLIVVIVLIVIVIVVIPVVHLKEGPGAPASLLVRLIWMWMETCFGVRSVSWSPQSARGKMELEFYRRNWSPIRAIILS